MSYGQWSVDEELTLKEFGYTSKKLGPQSRLPVKCRCLMCDVIANKRLRESNRRHRCISIIDGKKKCFKCKMFRPIEDFSKNRSTADGYQKVCKDCYNNYDSVKNWDKKKRNALKNSLEVYLNAAISRIKRKCVVKNLPTDLEKGDLYEILLQQNGKCYYSGIDIKHNVGCSQHDSLSIDRKNPEKGYTKDNIVLCSFNVNSFKGMFTENEFKEFLNIVIPKLIDYKDN